METADYLPISGIQHFCFCRRQWALIHIEQQWAENLRTAEGRLLHERRHDEALREKRGDLLTVRAMRVASHRLRLTGVCDVVELSADPAGIALQGQVGLWMPMPGAIFCFSYPGASPALMGACYGKRARPVRRGSGRPLHMTTTIQTLSRRLCTPGAATASVSRETTAWRYSPCEMLP